LLLSGLRLLVGLLLALRLLTLLALWWLAAIPRRFLKLCQHLFERLGVGAQTLLCFAELLHSLGLAIAECGLTPFRRACLPAFFRLHRPVTIGVARIDLGSRSPERGHEHRLFFVHLFHFLPGLFVAVPFAIGVRLGRFRRILLAGAFQFLAVFRRIRHLGELRVAA